MPRREAVYLLGDGKDDSVAICTGRWKLIDRKRSETKELFDLENDPGETSDVAAEHPEVVKRLAAALVKNRKAGTIRLPVIASQL